jgi:hypothetical protein
MTRPVLYLPERTFRPLHRRANEQKASGSDDTFTKEFDWRLQRPTTHISRGAELTLDGIRREMRHNRRNSRWWNWYSNSIVPDVEVCIDMGQSKHPNVLGGGA